MSNADAAIEAAQSDEGFKDAVEEDYDEGVYDCSCRAG